MWLIRYPTSTPWWIFCRQQRVDRPCQGSALFNRKSRNARVGCGQKRMQWSGDVAGGWNQPAGDKLADAVKAIAHYRTAVGFTTKVYPWLRAAQVSVISGSLLSEFASLGLAQIPVVHQSTGWKRLWTACAGDQLTPAGYRSDKQDVERLKQERTEEIVMLSSLMKWVMTMKI